MKLISIIALTMALGLSLVGCSNQWREAGQQISNAELETILTEVQSSNVSQLSLRSDENASIYYSEAPGTFGPVSAVLAFWDFLFLGVDTNPSRVRAIFMEAQTESGREVELVFGLSDSESFNYYSFSGTASVVNDEYVAEVSGTSGNLILRSYDLVDNELNNVIQILVYRNNGSGEELIGKISTLVSY